MVALSSPNSNLPVSKAHASGIDVVVNEESPDGVKVQLSKLVAAPAIDDHFNDVVLPTVSRAIHGQREKLILEADNQIRRRLEGEISQLVAPLLDEAVQRAVKKHGKFEAGMSIEIFNAATERTKILSRQHYMFPVLLKMMCIRDRNGNPLNISLNGPAGNGKTSMALNASEALGIPALLQPFNPQTSKADLLGYMDATGEYVPSPLYEAFTTGKIFIADEFDAANPAVAVTLNAAVANRTMTFPNLETVKAHPNFRAVFIGNTTGGGADHQYTGRLRQDAATLDRLVQLHVPIDEGLEAAIAGVNVDSPEINIKQGGRFRNNQEILETIRSVRHAAKALQMKYIISPRATIHATAMHAAGFGKKLIMDCCVWRGMPQVDQSALEQKAGFY